MSVIAQYSPATTTRRWNVVAIVAVSLALLAGGGYFAYSRLLAPAAVKHSFTFHRVEPINLDIVIKKEGELQAVKNLDVVSPVEGQNTITSIVEEGTVVKEGDVICELDSSEIRRKIQQATLDVKRAEAEAIAAKEQLAIQESKNAADLAAAKVELKLAQLDLREYTEGVYPAKLSEAERGVEMAKIALRDKQEALAEQRSLLLKEFVTASDVKKAEVEMLTAQNDLEKKQTDLKVLVEYTHEKELADKENKLAQAEGKVSRTQLENNSNLAQKQSEAQTKEQSLIVHRQTLEHLEKQLAACTIKAPGDGILVYGSTANPYNYREQPIQAGARIYERQLLARVPDTSNMKVVTKIQESQALKLRVDKENPLKAQVRIAGVEAPIAATVTQISLLPDSSNRWWNPDNKEYPVDLTLAATPAGLKPGLTANVEIFVNQLKGVLAVPITSLYSVADDTYVFVRERGPGGGVKPVQVKVGQTNETHAEITSGLERGVEVALLEIGQGRQLLEAAGIKVEEPEAEGEDAPIPTDAPAAQQTASVNN